mgnify:CR=1 FL=1
MKYRVLSVGDPAPWVTLPTSTHPSLRLDMAAGRYLLLCFFGSAGDQMAQAALSAVRARRSLFDDARVSFFGFSLDRRDVEAGRIKDDIPGVRFFQDFAATAATLFGAVSPEAQPAQGRIEMRPMWVVLDPMLRVIHVAAFDADPVASGNAVIDFIAALPPVSRHAGIEIPAPVLVLPNVFEAEFCRTLIALYEADGGTFSGFMDEVAGKTVVQESRDFKSRRDVHIEDRALQLDAQKRVQRRIVPEIKKVHQFDVTRVERYLVACYAAEDGGHFNAHRDNTTKGTAHRRFAVSINLNDDFDGGEVMFPEYGPKRFKPPAGGAVVFSCSLLHMVAPVTRGRRYAFLPFLYDEAAAKVREANNAHLGDGVAPYSAETGITAER